MKIAAKSLLPSQHCLLVACTCLAGLSLCGVRTHCSAQETNESADVFTSALTVDTPIDGKTPEERQRAFLQYCSSVEPPKTRDARVALVYLAARIYAGKDTEASLRKWQEIATSVYERSKQRLEENPKDNNARNPFEKHALIHSYLICREKTKIPPQLVETMRKYVALYKHKNWFGYGALNYRSMNDGAGFLAAEIWPDLVDSDGLNAKQIQEATKARLLGYCDEIVRRNTEEYGAPTYLGIDFSAFKMLAEFAKDPVVKQRAAYTLDSMLLHVACAWNNGYYVSPASRAKYWGSTITCPEHMDTTAGIGWLYFGGKRPVAAGRMNVGGAIWFGIVRDYRPPSIFNSIANDRSVPFVHRGSGREYIRFSIYQGDRYALASEWERLPSHTSSHYKESRRQMLKWVSPRPDSTFTPLQENLVRPYNLKQVQANAFGYGENPFSQSLQHEGTLIGIVSVPEDYPFWKSYAPFTTDGAILKRTEKDGWVFCHGGSVLFAFRYLAPSSWGAPRETDKCDVLRSDSRQNGWVLETAPIKAFAGGGMDAELGRFAEAVLTKTKLDTAGMSGVNPRFTYRSLDGHLLDLTYRAHKESYSTQHKIDGKPVDYTSYPLFGNQWVNQPLNGETLKLQYKGKTLTYDFKNWTRTEGESH